MKPTTTPSSPQPADTTVSEALGSTASPPPRRNVRLWRARSSLCLPALVALLFTLLATIEPAPVAAQTPPPCPTRSATPTSDLRLTQDCNTLLELKDTLRSTATLDWARDTDPISWEGVTANTTDGVTQLFLDSQGSRSLTGTIPPALGNLTNLTSLQMANNQLTGSIPATLGNLANLTSLTLHGNQLTGAIPPALGNLTNLTVLSLTVNKLTGRIPAELGSLTNLTQLLLPTNQLSGPIPGALGSLTNLTHLHLYANQLNDPIPDTLGSLTNLQQLYLSDNRLTGPIPDTLGNLTNLTRLWLYDNRLTGPIPEELGQLTDLQYLLLHQNRLTGSIPPEFGNLTSLQWLYLYDNRLTGDIPETLGSLTNLQRLILQRNRLTGSIPEELGQLTDLQYLLLHLNDLTGSIPSELGNLTKLRWLYLYCNPQLSGPVPSGLFAIASLTRLHLYGTTITADDLPMDLTTTDLEKVVLEGSCASSTTNGDNNPHNDASDDDGSTRRACPPLVSPLLPLIGQTPAATAYALPGDRAVLHLHASAADSVVLDVGHIAADGATRVPGAFVRDADRGHTYTILRRDADGLIVRHWLAPTDPLRYAVPWDRVNTTYTFPAAVLAAIPLDDRHVAPDQLARRFDGTDPRVLAFDATRGQWWHVSHPAIFQALGFTWDDVTAADADFVPRLAPERAAPFPRIISRTAAATAYEVPGDRLVLHRHDIPAPAVVVGIGWIATDGATMVPVGFVRDADLGQTYAVVRRKADGLIVRYWIAPTDPLIYSVHLGPREHGPTPFPAAVLATLPLDDRYAPAPPTRPPLRWAGRPPLCLRCRPAAVVARARPGHLPRAGLRLAAGDGGRCGLCHPHHHQGGRPAAPPAPTARPGTSSRRVVPPTPTPAPPDHWADRYRHRL